MTVGSNDAGWVTEQLRIGGTTVHCRRSTAGDGVPVVHVHGFAISGAYLMPTARVLARRWVNVVPDLPGYGRSAGTPTEAGCYAAGDAAYAWVTTEGKVPPGRVVLLGESLGSGVAVDLATRHDHRALVLMCPFTSLPAAAKSHYPFLPTHTVMRSRFDSIAKIGSCCRPLYIAHGTADNVVPFWQGEALFDAANEPKEFLRVEGAGHGIGGDDFYGPLARFLDRYPATE